MIAESLKTTKKKPFVTIEATQTFSPGNVELLVYLVNKFKSNEFEIELYLGHESTIETIQNLNIDELNIYKTNVLFTFLRSLNPNKNVLFFCSYPPLRFHARSIVYYHSLFFSNPYKFLKEKKVPISAKLSRLIIHWIIKLFNKNVDFFYCQTEGVLIELLQNFKNINVEKKPFFNDNELNYFLSQNRDFRFDFFYPATADVHKNYFNLFEAVLILGQTRKISLVVTVANNKEKYLERIRQVNKSLKYEAIINIGRVPKNVVLQYFRRVKAMVFPSLEESLGLPLIEAAILDVPILASDLPYVYDVVKNPITFNPHDPADIAHKLDLFLLGKFEGIDQKNKVENKIEEIIDYFKY